MIRFSKFFLREWGEPGVICSKKHVSGPKSVGDTKFSRRFRLQGGVKSSCFVQSFYTSFQEKNQISMTKKSNATSWRLRDTVTKSAAAKYRLSEIQIQLIKDAPPGECVTDTARRAGCTRPSVYRWRVKNKTACAAGSGRPRAARTPAMLAALNKVVDENKSRPMCHAQLQAAVVKETGMNISRSSLQRAKRECGIKGKKGMGKPERAFYKQTREKRVKVAKERKRWTKAERRNLIFLDESCASRDCRKFFQVKADDDGKFPRPVMPKVDDKEEKVHFVVAIGGTGRNKVKFFKALAVRRPVLKDDEGNTIPRRGRYRRKAGKKRTKKLNLPNHGQTWTADRLKRTFAPLIEKFKASAGVVFDNASSHKALRTYLEKKGVTVYDHPPNSPDLNLAEDFIRDIKQQAINDQLPSNNKQLLASLQTTFNKPAMQKKFEERHNKRCDAYNVRLKEVIAGDGLPTRF